MVAETSVFIGLEVVVNVDAVVDDSDPAVVYVEVEELSP